jgi:hypothetical protein
MLWRIELLGPKKEKQYNSKKTGRHGPPDAYAKKKATQSIYHGTYWPRLQNIK